MNDNCSLEYPRAIETDDVECFFSIMRDIIGQNFTTKEVKYEICKVCAEFMKHADPDLLFYYHISWHTRYHERPLPNFVQPPKKKTIKRQVPRREQAATFGPRCVIMPVRSSTMFH